MKKYYINSIEFNKFILQKKNYYIIIFKKNIYYMYIFIPIIYINNNYYFSIKGKNKNILNFIFFSWKNYIIKKIKFKHKITWIYVYKKNLKLLKINTNYSEKLFFIINNLNIKKKKNYFSFHSIILWNLNIIEINNFIYKLINLFFYNSFNQKGFKLSRMKLIKRISKSAKYSTIKNKLV